MKFLSSLVLFLTPLTLALPITEAPVEDSIEARQCYSSCGGVCYTANQVTTSRNAGYSYYQKNTVAGSSTYPHAYNNYEGFTFLVAGPYFEFPLKTGAAYTGGAPGADRVIFNTRGQRAGELTHTGASGNAFVKCSGW